jgi:hypothetical protein
VGKRYENVKKLVEELINEVLNVETKIRNSILGKPK